MKKYVFLTVLAFVLVFLAGCNMSYLQLEKRNLSNYHMDIVMNEEENGFEIKQKVDYINNSEQIFETIDFHLYPNAFREGSTQKVVTLSSFTTAYYEGQDYSVMEIKNASVKGQENAEFEVGGVDDNILSFSLQEKLYPKDRVVIEIEYSLILPKINHRFGLGKSTINMGNFFPIACVYENGDFVRDTYSPNGDPFYSDMANFHVNITMPENFKIASSGEQIKSATSNGNITTEIKVDVVRDFAFVLSEKFEMIETSWEGVKVFYYYYDEENPQASLDISVVALKTFSNQFGKYPYKTLSVAKTSFVHGGMEFPTLVYISELVKHEKDYHNVIVHEIAHQWWYGVVGNDQYNNAWLDEGLTDYSTALFYELNPQYEVKINDIILQGVRAYTFYVETYSILYKGVDTTMNRPLNQYVNENEYGYIAYVKGMLLFDNLRRFVGDKAFFEGIKNYFETYKFKNATPENMIACFEKETGKDLETFFGSWIGGTVVILRASVDK